MEIRRKFDSLCIFKRSSKASGFYTNGGSAIFLHTFRDILNKFLTVGSAAPLATDMYMFI